jgi:hypothetical protein
LKVILQLKNRLNFVVLFPLLPQTGRPEKWTRGQVTQWIDSIRDEYELDEEEVADLRKANGKGLEMLDKDDWLRRSPAQGDLFYKLWKQLKVGKSSDGEDSQHQEGIVLFHFICKFVFPVAY